MEAALTEEVWGREQGRGGGGDQMENIVLYQQLGAQDCSLEVREGRKCNLLMFNNFLNEEPSEFVVFTKCMADATKIANTFVLLGRLPALVSSKHMRRQV